MRYKPNWEEAQKHFEAFWNCGYEERCGLAMQVPSGKGQGPRRDFSLEEVYTDPDCMHLATETHCRNTAFLGESIPVLNLNFGTAGHCAYFGCKPHYARDTIWFDPVLEEADGSALRFGAQGRRCFSAHIGLAERLAALAQDSYFVSMPDNCGITDCLAELRGTENLLVDMLENPGFVREAMGKITAVWRETQGEFFGRLKNNCLGGSAHSWMQLWCPRRHVQIQCDYSVMISPKMFEDFVLPELTETSEAFDYTTYHLDGVEQLRHLDMILSVKSINNIQWTPVEGQPLTSQNIEALQKIQKAGKGLVLIPRPQEAEFLMKNLSHKGLHLVVNGLKDEGEARELEALARKLAH